MGEVDREGVRLESATCFCAQVRTARRIWTRPIARSITHTVQDLASLTGVTHQVGQPYLAGEM